MPKVKEPVGVIMRRPLETDKGKSFLFINRPSTGLSTSGTAIFAVDSLTVSDYVSGMTEFGEIAFSKDIPFLLIPRPLCRPVSIKELAKINIAEKKEWEKAYDSLPKDDEDGAILPEPSTGTYL